MPGSYTEELRNYQSWDSLEERVVRLQLPYTDKDVPPPTTEDTARRTVHVPAPPTPPAMPVAAANAGLKRGAPQSLALPALSPDAAPWPRRGHVSAAPSPRRRCNLL